MNTALRAYVKRRLEFALRRFGPRVGLVTVRIADTNGPRGGVDKLCRVNAEILGSGKAVQSVVLEEEDAHLYAAVDRAADRLGRSVARQLERAREMPRSGRLALLVNLAKRLRTPHTEVSQEEDHEPREE